MKTMMLFAASVLVTLSSFSQNVTVNPFPRTITVTGSAEMEILPDEIYVLVQLKEYEKKGSGKVSIDKIRQDFLAAVRSLGIADSLISIAAYDGRDPNPWRKKKDKKQELYASISYIIKLKSSAQVDQLVDKLDDNATENFYIQKTSHSKLAEYRKNLKIQAVKAAKEKAQYLAGALNETVGVAVSINEPNEFYQPYIASNQMMRAEAGGANGEPQADFQKINLRYEITVVFELK